MRPSTLFLSGRDWTGSPAPDPDRRQVGMGRPALPAPAYGCPESEAAQGGIDHCHVIFTREPRVSVAAVGHSWEWGGEAKQGCLRCPIPDLEIRGPALSLTGRPEASLLTYH